MTERPDRPGACYVVCGPNANYLRIAGMRVSAVHERWQVIFNPHPQSRYFVDGKEVDGDYVMQLNDENLEFVRPFGQKGVGRLFSPDELIQDWKISHDFYDYLVSLGLPTMRDSSTGQFYHPEVAVDEWFRKSGPQNEVNIFLPPRAAGSGPGVASFEGALPEASDDSLKKKVRVKVRVHFANEDPPRDYHGPLVGQLQQLAQWICITPDRRNLKPKAAVEVIWIRMQHTRLYEVWFKSESEYKIASQKAEKQREGKGP